jgi:hypothetical protein
MKASTSLQAQTDAQCTRCFLEDVARSLDGLLELGDGVVARTCAEVQKHLARARSHACGRVSKYR